MRFFANEAVACDVQGAWLPLILMLQNWKFFMVILEAQITQICSMNVLRLITDFIKMSKVWFLSMEFMVRGKKQGRRQLFKTGMAIAYA